MITKSQREVWVFAMVIVINTVIGVFSWLDYIDWFDYRRLITATCPVTPSNYNCTEWSVKNKTANAPITFDEIVTVIINI